MGIESRIVTRTRGLVESKDEKLLPFWDARVSKCREYLKKCPTIKIAIVEAEKDLFFASNVAWISALLSMGKDLL